MSELTIARFKLRIGLFVGLLLFSIFSLSVWSIYSEYRHIIHDAERLSASYSRALSEHAESALAESDLISRNILHEIAELTPAKRADQQLLYRIISNQAKGAPQIGSVFLTDRNGVMYLNTYSFPSPQVNVADREYFRHYLEHPDAGLYISKPLVSRLVNRWRFNLIRPLKDKRGQFDGLVSIAFETKYFHNFFTLESLGANGRLLLIRDDGTPLVTAPEEDRSYAMSFADTALFKKYLPESAAGTYHLKQSILHKDPRIVSYQRLKRYPVIAVVSMNRDEVLAQWYRKSVPHTLITTILCLAALLLTRLLFRHLDRLHAAQTTVAEQQQQLATKAAQIDAATDAILEIDENGLLIQFNQALCHMTGYTPEELEGKHLHDIQPEDQAGQIIPNIEHIFQNNEAMFESSYRAKNGAIIPIEGHSRLLPMTGGAFRILSIVRDITQRKHAERRERTRLAILEEMATGVGLEQLLTHIVHFVEQESPGALCSVLLVDDTGNHLRHGAAPSLPEEYNQAVSGLRIGHGMGSCGTASHTGQRVIVEEIEGHPFWKGFKPARDAGLRACWSEPIFSSNRELLGTFAIYYMEPRSPGDEAINLIESAAHLAGIAIDRVREEELRKKLEEQLLHIQKIEAIGQLAGGIAHDFNNLLTPIIVYADMLQTRLQDDAPQRKKAEGILSAANKARDLTQKLLSFGRKQMLCMMPHDLNEIIDSFYDILRSTIRENIGLELHLAHESSIIMGDRGQLEQVLLNLAVNAQDAIREHGAITIETGHVTLDDEFTRLHPGMKPGSFILLSFSDSGCGMSDDTLSHIFEPFYTTKPVGHGTGLGLATAYGIIKQHDGYIAVTSSEGQGTTFRIYLPQQSGEASKQKDAVTQAEETVVEADERTVLVVEDNAMVREMLRDVLEVHHYKILVADGPQHALQLVSSGQPIDLLISDIVMPEMNGRELYERLLVPYPGLPVLFISGHTRDVIISHGTLEEDVDFLQKPFTAEELLRKITSIFSQPTV